MQPAQFAVRPLRSLDGRHFSWQIIERERGHDQMICESLAVYDSMNDALFAGQDVLLTSGFVAALRDRSQLR